MEVSPFKVSTEHDVVLLREFGVGKPGTRDDAKLGVYPRIENLFRAVERRAREDEESLRKERPAMEFLASQVPKAYLRLAKLTVEIWDTKEGRERAKGYIRSFLENSHGLDGRNAWLALADLCQADEDVLGEMHALCETALLVTQDQQTFGLIINRMNARIKQLKDENVEAVRSIAVTELIERVCDRAWSVRKTLSATICSRLAWLYLNVGRGEAAREMTGIGLEKEPGNIYCVKLERKLGM